ncbi:frequency clock protein [Fusarium oxysporum f. sp. albedinis]|nr:frequency clock protein [Fusarium oxysporum f. sp. albedinis]
MLPDRSSSHEPQPSFTGYHLPRRASPQKSITLCHHGLACDASLRMSSGSAAPKVINEATSMRRNSSNDSEEAEQSDPQNWFDHSNENPSATADNNIMNIAHSSGAEDYRSVIDDLTVEIQTLRQELKRYKQTRLDRLSKHKLFEVKVYGLQKQKKAELEGILRDFVARLDGPPNVSSTSQRETKLPPQSYDLTYSRSRFHFHHASPSLGSRLRLTDSAYASISTGAKSSNTSVSRPTRTKSSAKSSKQKVEDYLQGIPESLDPPYAGMTDRERKKLVVGRLEQLFTGKLMRLSGSSALASVVADARTAASSTVHKQPTLGAEPPPEARIHSVEQRSGHSASNPKKDNTETRGNGKSACSEANSRPPASPPPEQRPTILRNLDPYRVQIPPENMHHIWHSGLMPPELLFEQQTTQDVHVDGEGWVYLNLLCNLAPFQVLGITPDFIRSAVSEMSAKLQLSPDGRKIRWRGGSNSTEFGTHTSGYNSPKNPSTNDVDGSGRERKRLKVGCSTGKKFQSGASRLSLRFCAPPETFHYKPLFAQQDSRSRQPSLDNTLSSSGLVEDSNPSGSRWDLKSSGKPTYRKQRREGAITYYSGAPFCIDLSGDPGDSSLSTNTLPNGQHQTVPEQSSDSAQSPPRLTVSGSFINYRPLTDRGQVLHQQNSATDGDNDESESLLSDSSEGTSGIEMDWIWSESQQHMEYQSLEPSGLGGTFPDDRFIMVVTTKRPKQDIIPSTLASQNWRSDESTKRTNRWLATISNPSPAHGGLKITPSEEPPSTEIEYLSWRIERPAPVSLPPPAIFFPPFSSNSCTSDEDGNISEAVDDTELSGDYVSRRVKSYSSVPHPKRVYLSSGDEEDDDSERLSGYHNTGHVTQGNAERILSSRPRQAACRTSSAASAAGTARESTKRTAAGIAQFDDEGSIATVGAAESGYSSSCEDSS